MNKYSVVGWGRRFDKKNSDEGMEMSAGSASEKME